MEGITPPAGQLSRRAFLGGSLAAGTSLFLPRTARGAPVSPLLSAEELYREPTEEERELLRQTQAQGIRYALENQHPNHGLIADTQYNHGPLTPLDDLRYSTASTGMGLIAIALGTLEPHGLLSRDEAVERCIRAGMTALWRLREDHGGFAHFIEQRYGELVSWGDDAIATIDSTWLLAGIGTAANILQDPELQRIAAQLIERMDWRYWTAAYEADVELSLLICHGKNHKGQFLGTTYDGVRVATRWNRLNSETSFMYVLAAGASDDKAIHPGAWQELQPRIGKVAGLEFMSAGDGLFLNQYGDKLLNAHNPGAMDLHESARLAALADYLHCNQLSTKYRTFEVLWGLSAGRGPCKANGEGYFAHSPTDTDGTANPLATIASYEDLPGAVMQNMHNSKELPGVWGRYGPSSVNLNESLVCEQVAGIDPEMMAIGLASALQNDAVRTAFRGIPQVQRGLERLGFTGPSEEQLKNIDASVRSRLAQLVGN